MRITVSFSRIVETKPPEFAIRFIFGGLVTALAGLVAMQFGPVIGGLFLAFPAILPSSLTLIERHEIKKKEEHGMTGTERGRDAAAAEAAGATMGSLGLFVFGLIVWKFISLYSPWIVLIGGTAAWFVVAAVAWWIRQRL